jgi:hypothetical protein
MVREVAADGPKKPTEPLVAHTEKQTVCALSSDSPQSTRVAHMVRDVQVDGSRNTPPPPPGKKKHKDAQGNYP